MNVVHPATRECADQCARTRVGIVINDDKHRGGLHTGRLAAQCVNSGRQEIVPLISSHSNDNLQLIPAISAHIAPPPLPDYLPLHVLSSFTKEDHHSSRHLLRLHDRSMPSSPAIGQHISLESELIARQRTMLITIMRIRLRLTGLSRAGVRHGR